mgnify:CR=1 FL=1
MASQDITYDPYAMKRAKQRGIKLSHVERVITMPETDEQLRGGFRELSGTVDGFRVWVTINQIGRVKNVVRVWGGPTGGQS